MKKGGLRYFITDVVNVPLVRLGSKGEAYRYATHPCSYCVDWYSADDGYTVPCNRDRSDKTQKLLCMSDIAFTILDKSGNSFCFVEGDEVIRKDLPKQADVAAIAIYDAHQISIWGDCKIFVSYDENGLIDTYRVDVEGDAFEGETEISFEDLPTEEEAKDRTSIRGTFEFSSKQDEGPAQKTAEATEDTETAQDTDNAQKAAEGHQKGKLNMTYNYLEAIKADVLEYISENVNLAEWRGDRDGLEGHLNDKLWAEDSVTGNASGSYTFSTWEAEENLCHNWDLLQEALSEFGCEKSPIERGAEWCDVTIRCYLLSQAISKALDELEEELEEPEEGESNA